MGAGLTAVTCEQQQFGDGFRRDLEKVSDDFFWAQGEKDLEF
jgi:hypothetical protein